VFPVVRPFRLISCSGPVEFISLSRFFFIRSSFRVIDTPLGPSLCERHSLGCVCIFTFSLKKCLISEDIPALTIRSCPYVAERHGSTEKRFPCPFLRSPRVFFYSDTDISIRFFFQWIPVAPPFQIGQTFLVYQLPSSSHQTNLWQTLLKHLIGRCEEFIASLWCFFELVPEFGCGLTT